MQLEVIALDLSLPCLHQYRTCGRYVKELSLIHSMLLQDRDLKAARLENEAGQ
jgi:hypothetical protein